MLALYRKYRPQTFHQVVGQTLVTQPLMHAVATGNLSHAYLFAGPRGAGKTSMAKILAKAANCLHPTAGDACNTCQNCRLIDAGKAIDVQEIDGASNNGVEEVRAIIDQLKFFPALLPRRVYIIDEAQMLSNAAWNAFLKTLEEPSQNVIFIFTTTEPNKVPITVLSRCQRFQFQRLNDGQLNDLLAKVAEAEGIKLTPEARESVVHLADGSARDGLSILDQLASFAVPKITTDLIDSLFGLASLSQKVAYLTALRDHQLATAQTILQQLLERGLDGSLFCQELIKILLDCLQWSRSTAQPSTLQVLTPETVEKLNLPEELIATWIPQLAQTDSQIKKYSQTPFYLQLLTATMDGGIK